MLRAILAPDTFLVPLLVAGFGVIACAWFLPKVRPGVGAVPGGGESAPPDTRSVPPRPLHLLLVSWYGEDHRGRLTASGKPFDPDALTCAHPYLPFGTRLRLALEGRVVDVTVNDRGPYIGGRDLDVSRAAAERLGMTQAGLALVDVEVLP